MSLTYRQQSLAWLVHLQRRARSEGNRQSCFPLAARTEEGGGVPPGERTPRNYRARPVPARRRGDQRRGGRLFQVQAGKTWVPESNHPRRPPSRALSRRRNHSSGPDCRGPPSPRVLSHHRPLMPVLACLLRCQIFLLPVWYFWGPGLFLFSSVYVVPFFLFSLSSHLEFVLPSVAMQ